MYSLWEGVERRERAGNEQLSAVRPLYEFRILLRFSQFGVLNIADDSMHSD